MKKGYARTSNRDKEYLFRQTEALKRYGVDEIYVDEGFSGFNFERPSFRKLMKSLSAGDTIVTTSNCRISRDLQLFLSFKEELQFKNVELESLNHSI